MNYSILTGMILANEWGGLRVMQPGVALLLALTLRLLRLSLRRVSNGLVTQAVWLPHSYTRCQATGGLCRVVYSFIALVTA